MPMDEMEIEERAKELVKAMATAAEETPRGGLTRLTADDPRVDGLERL